MEQINTTTHRQYVDKHDQEDLEVRYKVVSAGGDELYISIVYTEDGEIENRYEPNHRGWEYGHEIDESELPDEHIEELSDIKERLSVPESMSSEMEKEKVRI